MIYLWVSLAGGLGAGLRFSVSRLLLSQGWVGFPYATLLVNVIGSFAIGYLAWSLVQKWGVSEELKLIVVTGFLGGFTTFSAFSLEVVSMLELGSWIRAFLYLGMTVFLCVALCGLGVFFAKLSG